MNLKQLEAFVQVAEGGSFSKAAKELFLTQPTISAHISSLEKELNSRLFVRNTKEVGLSEDGKDLYKYARQMIDLEKQIEERFEDERGWGQTLYYHCGVYHSGSVSASEGADTFFRALSGGTVENFGDGQLSGSDADRRSHGGCRVYWNGAGEEALQIYSVL